MAKQQKSKKDPGRQTRRPRLKGSVKKAVADRLARAHDSRVKEAADVWHEAFRVARESFLREANGVGERTLALADIEARKAAGTALAKWKRQSR